MNETLTDIVIFGSSVKGGVANDLDLALILKSEVDLNETKKKIRILIKKEVDIQVVNMDSIYDPIWLTLIKEGFSIKKGKYLFELYKIKPQVLYKYSLKKLTNVQKVQFTRGVKNLIGTKGKLLTRSVVLVPIEIKGDMDDLLKNWGVFYESQEYELIPVLRKENLF